ncbi:MAG: LuxR family transcriptional regulator, partial [Nocardioidaceae bacterium]
RTLYQHSARQSPATREYVAEVTQHGAEVRTLDEFFNRLIVVDRHVAIIPSSAGDQVAVAIHDSSLIDYLVDIFDRSWERARPFTAHDARSERSIASDVRAMTIRLLVEGHSDPASAKRLGVSTRTYAGYIAALKEEYGVQTRFQLGHAMGIATARTDPADDPAAADSSE